MDNKSSSEIASNVDGRSLIARATSIIGSFFGSFIIVYFTITALIKRIFISGPESFPAVWQDWAIIIALVPVSFLIMIIFLVILKDVGIDYAQTSEGDNEN